MLETASHWSLRRRVTVISALAIFIAVVTGGLATYAAAEYADDKDRDARLQLLGATMRSFIEHELSEMGVEGATGVWQVERPPTAGEMYRYEVWSRDGELLLNSHKGSPDQPLTNLTHSGLETVRVDGELYRSLSIPTTDGSAVIIVAECMDEWSEQVGMVAGYYMAFLLLPFGLLFGASWWLLRRSFSSIDALAKHLGNRNPLDTSRPKIHDPPSEMQPSLRALDELFGRIGRTISVERRFTAVAAHELRTPMSGIRAQAQLACTAHTQAELQEALAALMRGVDRGSHMLDQLLDLARVESMSKEFDPGRQRVDIGMAFLEVMCDLSARATAKRIDVATDIREVNLQGPDSTLPFFLLLRNLIANAILYSPEGSRIVVSTERDGAYVILNVDDSGPGIHALNRERAFERFNRLGQSRTDGVGLGLSIVLLVVELYRAKIKLLDSPLGGLRAQVHFPQPDLQRVSTPEPSAAIA